MIEEPPSPFKKEIDYKQYAKDRFEISDVEIEKIELMEGRNLPENYKRQIEALDDKRLENVKILVVPDVIWKKSQPSESAAEQNIISFNESYFKETKKPDEIAWLLHESAHCKRFLDSETPEAYQKDMETPAFTDINSDILYPNNKVEEYAFTKQMEYLKNNNIPKEQVIRLFKKYYEEDDFLFISKILDKIYNN